MIDYFILCSPRSGSTFLRVNLNKIDGIITLPETHFFGFYHENKKLDFSVDSDRLKAINRWMDWYKVKRLKLENAQLRKHLENKATSWKQLHDQTIEYYIAKKHPGSKNNKVIEKSSIHLMYQDYIKEFYPRAKVIYLVRDPRAVIASLKTCSWSTSNAVTNARVWRKGVREFNKITPSIIIKYEDMVSDPDTTLKTIFDFLKVEGGISIFNSQTKDAIEKESSTSENALQPLSTKHIDKWKDMLSYPDRDIEIIEYICKEEMNKYGYEQAGTNFDFRFVSHLLTGSLSLLLSKVA